MNRIGIDPNVRVNGNGTFAGLEDCEHPPLVDEPVIAWESESGAEWPARVTEVDDDKRLVYLTVAWGHGRIGPLLG